MRAHHTHAGVRRPGKGRGRTVIAFALAFSLLAGALALAFQVLKAGPELVSLAGRPPRQPLSIVFVSGDMGARR